jgi:hypothetical protein
MAGLANPLWFLHLTLVGLPHDSDLAYLALGLFERRPLLDGALQALNNLSSHAFERRRIDIDLV